MSRTRKKSKEEGQRERGGGGGGERERKRERERERESTHPNNPTVCADWLHRAMHCDPLFSLFHSVHHSFVPSTATCSEAFHPLDLAGLTLGTVWLPLLTPVWHPAFLYVLFFNGVYSAFQHTGSRTDLGVWCLSDAHTHNIHHDYGKKPVNCGSVTTVWDRMMGTYKHRVPGWAKTKWKGKGIYQESAEPLPTPSPSSATGDETTKEK